MIDLETFKTTVTAWIDQALPDMEVYWRHQGQPEPDRYVTVWPISLLPLTVIDSKTERYDEALDLIEIKSVGARRLRMQIDVWSEARFPPNDAISLGSKLYDSLRSVKAQELFNLAGIGVLPLDDQLDIRAMLKSNEWDGRFTFEVSFQIESAHFEFVDYFTSVTVSSDVPEIDPPIVQTISLE